MMTTGGSPPPGSPRSRSTPSPSGRRQSEITRSGGPVGREHPRAASRVSTTVTSKAPARLSKARRDSSAWAGSSSTRSTWMEDGASRFGIPPVCLPDEISVPRAGSCDPSSFFTETYRYDHGRDGSPSVACPVQKRRPCQPRRRCWTGFSSRGSSRSCSSPSSRSGPPGRAVQSRVPGPGTQRDQRRAARGAVRVRPSQAGRGGDRSGVHRVVPAGGGSAPRRPRLSLNVHASTLGRDPGFPEFFLGHARDAGIDRRSWWSRSWSTPRPSTSPASAGPSRSFAGRVSPSPWTTSASASPTTG